MQSERLRVPRDVVEARRTSPWWGVHAARYAFAAGIVPTGPLLDIACGTGYGVHFLAADRLLVGADLEHAAVAQAADRAHAAGLMRTGWTVADGTALPFAKGSFEAVTSMETIEHLHRRPAFLKELVRVLRPGGVLVLSTPNAYHSRPVNGVPLNPYHVHEYTPDELRNELGRRFSSVELLGQTMSRRFRVSPFQEDWPHVTGAVGRGRLLAWRLLNKAPVAAREGISRAVARHDFYPTEHDYEFSAASVDTAPVLVAICRQPRAC